MIESLPVDSVTQTLIQSDITTHTEQSEGVIDQTEEN